MDENRDAPEANLPQISPDVSEVELQDEIDNIVPSRGYQMTPMVGLGGSAGSIKALRQFFEKMPPDSGMIFVVILHLSPSHESSLADILAKSTAMPVVSAVDSQKVEPNHVYVIPPGKHLTTVDGHLRLTNLRAEFGKREAVDLFFRSLADTHGPHAVAIVLSGIDGDGAIGIKRIKERGGLAIAQEPEEAEQSGMPRAAIATGMVDWILHVSEMPNRLVEFCENEVRLRLPPEEGPVIPSNQPLPTDDGEIALRDVLVFLRTRTGCDFSYYKRATIVRRVARRMQVNSVEDVPAYLRFLRTHPGEAGALLQDLLISVTNFFRDRETFKILEQHIPTLFKGKKSSDSIRVWVPACATGEEAYSIAILLLEHAQKLDAPPLLQVFACDLDDGAIKTARGGHYPEAIVADVSEERLRRFFIRDHNGYRVRRELREMVLFATHDLLKDPPFARMDMISCRNLLIYLNRDAQKRVFDIFHFAMHSGGILFLGTSESVDDDNQMFGVLDKKHRLYLREPGPRSGLPVPTGPSALLRVIEAQDKAHAQPVVHGKRFVSETPPLLGFPKQQMDRAALAELHLRLLERLGPASFLINGDHELVHLSENAAEFLKFSGGEISTNLFRIIHPELRVEVRTAVFRANELNEMAETLGIPIQLGDHRYLIDIRVTPAHDLHPGYFIVVLEKRSAEGTAQSSALISHPPVNEPVVRHLERELEQVKGRLRDTIEQYEASTEELKASNEELQAMNEELRSATEELESSREELQSINEELTTVNQEMKGKMDEIAHANSDLQNLMASTSIATVFLDRQLAITRYTPSAVDLFHLIPGDIDLPLWFVPGVMRVRPFDWT